MTTLQAIPSKPWSRIVARAWADEDFQDRLLSDPKVVLREYGIETEGEVCVSVAETPDSGRTDDVLHLILHACRISHKLTKPRKDLGFLAVRE